MKIGSVELPGILALIQRNPLSQAVLHASDTQAVGLRQRPYRAVSLALIHDGLIAHELPYILQRYTMKQSIAQHFTGEAVSLSERPAAWIVLPFVCDRLACVHFPSLIHFPESSISVRAFFGLSFSARAKSDRQA